MLESLIETNYSKEIVNDIITCDIIKEHSFGEFVKHQREMLINAYIYNQDGDDKMRDEFTNRAITFSNETAELIGIDEEIFGDIMTVLVNRPEIKALL